MGRHTSEHYVNDLEYRQYGLAFTSVGKTLP